MKTILISLLIQIVQQLVSSALYQCIQHAVLQAERSGDSGAQKHAAVLASVSDTEEFRDAAKWAVNLAIETAVAKVRFT